MREKKQGERKEEMAKKRKKMLRNKLCALEDRESRKQKEGKI